MDVNPRCEFCLHWHRNPPRRRYAEGSGDCWRYPQIVEKSAHERCGEFQYDQEHHDAASQRE